MTVVQQVVATQSYLQMSEEIRNCGQDPSLGDCVTKDYLARLRARCSCLPHPLAGAGDSVCGPRDQECVASVILNTGHCLVPCHGLYADVKDSNQLRLRVEKQPKYKLLEQEYENYTYFYEPNIKSSSFPGHRFENM